MELDCPHCGGHLRLAEDVAGMRVRCPLCQQTWVAAASDSAAAAVSAPGCWLKIPEERVYGPVTWEELDTWVSEGRVTADCHVSLDQRESWQRAAQHYPFLDRPAGRARVHPFQEGTVVPAPRGPGRPAEDTSGRYVAAHRGPVVLMLGVGAWLLCPMLGFFAWIMGSSDLQDMQEGRMDASGEGLTRAGYLLGMIQVMLLLLLLVAAMFLAMIGLALGWR